MEPAQIIQKVLGEYSETSQVIHVFVRKMQILDIVYNLFESCHNGISPFIGIVPEEHIEHNSFIFLSFKISLHHG